MRNNEINIAIAKVCGWKEEDCPQPTKHWISPTGNQCWSMPNYVHDLDAMRDATMHMKRTSRMDYYGMHKELERIVGIGNSKDEEHSWMTADATAHQRAEAFLRVKGLWK